MREIYNRLEGYHNIETDRRSDTISYSKGLSLDLCVKEDYLKHISILISSGLYAGFMRFAPGTWGTLVGSVIVIALWQMQFLSSSWDIPLLTLLGSMIGYWSIRQLPQSWQHDDQRIVIDEIVGVWMTLVLIPITWLTIVLSFVLFRIFDIWKPLGIRKFDDMTSDAGVILDDLVAGVYANLMLRLILLMIGTNEFY